MPKAWIGARSLVVGNEADPVKHKGYCYEDIQHHDTGSIP
jgi:hypothetical protein